MAPESTADDAVATAAVASAAHAKRVAPRTYWLSDKTLDWIGVCLLHCIFAVACAAAMHSLLVYALDLNSRSSCMLAKNCTDSVGYTFGGVFQDLRQMFSFALGAVTCSFFLDGQEQRVDSASEENDDGGLLRLTFQIVSFL